MLWPCTGLQAAASRDGDLARLAARRGRCSRRHVGGAGVRPGGAAALRPPPRLWQPSGARLRAALPQGMRLQGKACSFSCVSWCALPQAASQCACAVCQVKEEGWWLVLGDAASQELHAVKRLSFAERAVARLVIPARTAAGAPVKGVTLLHLVRLLLWQPMPCLWPSAERLADRGACRQVSDAYLGLDQRHEVEVPGSGAPAAMRDPSRQAVRDGEVGEPASAAVPAGPGHAEVASRTARARDAAALALQGPASRIARNTG